MGHGIINQQTNMLQHLTVQITKCHGSEGGKPVLAKVKVRLTSNKWTYIGVGEAVRSQVE
jgi:hypothetical protein